MEASQPQADQNIYQFEAWEHDACLGVEAPWGGLNIIRIIMTPGHPVVPESERGTSPWSRSYAEALKDWENGIEPLPHLEWLERVRAEQGAQGHA